jgi:formate/nitrite transporter FocA (FNT family)
MSKAAQDSSHYAKEQLVTFAVKAGVLLSLTLLVGSTIWVRFNNDDAGLLSLIGAVACLGLPVAYIDLKDWFTSTKRSKRSVMTYR